MDVAVCSHFAGFLASILVFIKDRSLRSLTFHLGDVTPVVRRAGLALQLVRSCKGLCYQVAEEPQLSRHRIAVQRVTVAIFDHLVQEF